MNVLMLIGCLCGGKKGVLHGFLGKRVCERDEVFALIFFAPKRAFIKNTTARHSAMPGCVFIKGNEQKFFYFAL